MNRLKGVLRNQAQGVTSEKPASANVLAAIQAAVAADSDGAIKALQKELDKSEAECKRLNAEITRLGGLLRSAQAATQTEVEKVRNESKKEFERQCAKHNQAVQALQEKLTKAQEETTRECNLKVRAESDCAAESKLRAGAERALAALRDIKPAKPIQPPTVQAIMPQAQPMKPLTMTVSQRDSSGRIAAITITPST
jgi:uncharacterized protein YukE